MNNYIFGYGSLVNKRSRDPTAGSALIGPARVHGVRRGWKVQDNDETVLGAVLEPGAVCNGVIVSVSEEELAKYDKRESPSEYGRVELKAEDIDLLNGQSPSGIFWTYVAKNPRDPDAKHPIPQSYIDVVLNGFLDFGLDFAREFIESTAGWGYIVNDRDGEKAPKDIERRTEIDALLHYGVSAVGQES